MDFIVRDDFGFIEIIAGLGNMRTVPRAFIAVRCIRVISRLNDLAFSLLFMLSFTQSKPAFGLTCVPLLNRIGNQCKTIFIQAFYK